MSAKRELAAEAFGEGFNCSQSVLSVFCEEYGLEKETAMKVACGLGGGCRSGEICGAVSGGVLVIGLKYGQHTAGDKDSKSLCYAKTAEFVNNFKAKNGSVVCREILKREGKKACPDMIKSSVSLLEELGY